MFLPLDLRTVYEREGQAMCQVIPSTYRGHNSLQVATSLTDPEGLTPQVGPLCAEAWPVPFTWLWKLGRLSDGKIFILYRAFIAPS